MNSLIRLIYKNGTRIVEPILALFEEDLGTR